MKKRGALTAKLGKYLEDRSERLEITVYHDHGEGYTNIGEIQAYIGKGMRQGTGMAEVDFAILRQGKVILLIEVEEFADRPKTIIGDALAVCLSGKIEFKGEPLKVGEGTTLLVACKRAKGNHKLRLEEIESRINNLIMNADEDGLKIKDVKLVLFDDLVDLFETIKTYL